MPLQVTMTGQFYHRFNCRLLSYDIPTILIREGPGIRSFVSFSLVMDFQCSGQVVLLQASVTCVTGPSEMHQTGPGSTNGVSNICFANKLTSSLPENLLRVGNDVSCIRLCSVSHIRDCKQSQTNYFELICKE
jgi:hypothetical protein